MTPHDFVARWQAADLSERAACQSHFADLCAVLGQPKPTDMIEVVVKEGKERLAYSPRRIKLAGTFYLADMPTQSLGLRNVWGIAIRQSPAPGAPVLATAA